MPHQTWRQDRKNENLSGHFAFVLENKNQQSMPLLCIGPYTRSFWEPKTDGSDVGLQKCTYDLVYTRNIEIFSIQVTSAVSHKECGMRMARASFRHRYLPTHNGDTWWDCCQSSPIICRQKWNLPSNNMKSCHCEQVLNYTVFSCLWLSISFNMVSLVASLTQEFTGYPRLVLNLQPFYLRLPSAGITSVTLGPA